jgi:hypothetical protein
MAVMIVVMVMVRAWWLFVVSPLRLVKVNRNENECAHSENHGVEGNRVLDSCADIPEEHERRDVDGGGSVCTKALERFHVLIIPDCS